MLAKPRTIKDIINFFRYIFKKNQQIKENR